jgi:hypothetical protein
MKFFLIWLHFIYRQSTWNYFINLIDRQLNDASTVTGELNVDSKLFRVDKMLVSRKHSWCNASNIPDKIAIANNLKYSPASHGETEKSHLEFFICLDDCREWMMMNMIRWLIYIKMISKANETEGVIDNQKR